MEVGGQQCPEQFGTNRQTPFTVDRTHMFYLNTAAPAPCSGNVTRFRYCYYRPLSDEIIDGHNYQARLAVYRPVNLANGSFRYVRVSNLTTIFRNSATINSSGAFRCRNRNNIGFNFEIQVGDIFGVCIFYSAENFIHQLDLVGQTSGYSLMGMSADGCSRTTIPSSISSNQLSVISQRILHVYADITGM